MQDLTRHPSVANRIARALDKQLDKGFDDNHDDEHVPGDWILYLNKRIGRLSQLIINANDEVDPDDWDREMAKVAALAIRALEQTARV